MKNLSFYLTEASNTKTLHIDNAVLDSNRWNLPDYAGIYFVFAGKLECEGDRQFTLNEARLLYIGEAKDIYSRHNDANGEPCHEHYKDFINALQTGEYLAYAFGRVTDGPYSRKMIESALIYQFQPIINDKSTKGYHHRDTEITITSEHDFPFRGKFIIKAAK